MTISALEHAPAELIGDAVDVAPLAGGTNHHTWLVTRGDGSRLVLKTTPGLAADVFDAEAEGLRALAGSGAVGAPAVLGFGAGFLALDALAPAPALDDTAFWARTGRALARLHARRGERFGWHRDNWLGLVRQRNPWTEDCYEFFVHHRVLRFLPEHGVRAVLEPAELTAIERICERLPDLVPPSYPALTHGDLWTGNVLAAADGGPALIDPAVSWSWPEVDVAMMQGDQRAPEAFFAGYHEIRPPADADWREQLRLLHIRELLCVLAHGELLPDARRWAVPEIRELIRRYA